MKRKKLYQVVLEEPACVNNPGALALMPIKKKKGDREREKVEGQASSGFDLVKLYAEKLSNPIWALRCEFCDNLLWQQQKTNILALPESKEVVKE